MAFAKSIKITLLAVAGFVAVAALTLLLRQSRSDAGGMSHATAYDFGEVVQGQPVEHEFAWRNTQRTALAVDTVITAYASMLLAADSLVPAGGEGKLRLRLDTRRLLGSVNELVKVRYKDPGRRPAWFLIRGRVVAPIELAPQDRVYFFTFRGEGPERELLVINHQDRPLRLNGVRSDNPRFRARTDTVIVGSRYRLTISLDPATPVGRDSARIELRTDSPQYPSLTIPTRAFVDDVVSAFPRAVDFGQIAFNSIDEQVIGKKVILVQKHQGSGFKVLGATLDVPYMDVAVVAQPAGQSFLVNVTIVKRRAQPGDIHGTLRITTNDPAHPEFVLPVSGKML